MVSQCLFHQAFLFGLAGSCGTWRKQVPLSSWQVPFLENTHCFVSFPLAKAWVSVRAGGEAQPILITTRAGKSSLVPPASLQCWPEQGALTPPLMLRVVLGPLCRRSPNPRAAGHNPCQTPARLRDVTAQRELRSPCCHHAYPAHTPTDTLCPKKFMAGGTRPAKIYTSFTRCG